MAEEKNEEAFNSYKIWLDSFTRKPSPQQSYIAGYEAGSPDGDKVVISKQSLKDLLFLAKDYDTRGHYSQAAYDKFAAAVAEGKEKLGEK